MYIEQLGQDSWVTCHVCSLLCLNESLTPQNKIWVQIQWSQNLLSVSFTWNLFFLQTFLIISVLTGIITGCGCQESVNAIKANWWKNWENYLTTLMQLGWRLLKHSLCFPAPQEILWHQRVHALLHTAGGTGPPCRHPQLRRARLPDLNIC